MSKILAIVVPCYNESEVLPHSSTKFLEKINSLISINKISKESFICFVDDGSKDNTWEIIEDLSKSNKFFKGVKLSCNKGHQNALVAGLLHSAKKADVLVSIDSDLQDDINAIDKMLDAYIDGCDIVYGVRSLRETDTSFKKHTAQFFYKLMKIMGVNIIYNHADYRLTSKRVIENFNDYKEVNLFLRGIFPTIGYKNSIVYYERHERFAGESKYPLKKMLSFALEGITSFSTVPLRLVTIAGFITFTITILLGIWAFIQSIFGSTVKGWSSTILSIYALGAIQLISLGLIGEYIGKIYKEVKQRPKFFIDKLTSNF